MIRSFTICVIVIGCATSQNTACDSGWFGSKCEYKCRCTDDHCDVLGECVADAICLGGWFGPQCQYVDVAHGQTEQPVLTDSSDKTCLDDTSLTNVTFAFRRWIMFTWLRLITSSKIVNRRLGLSFNQGEMFEWCDRVVLETHSISFDIHCSMNEPVRILTLIGQVGDLCCLHVSGGRNIAMHQFANQSTIPENPTTPLGSNAEHPALKAVDGYSNVSIYGNGTCSRAVSGKDGIAYWQATFSMAYTVERFLIYFPRNSSIYTHGMTIISHNSANIASVNYTIPGFKLRPVYGFLHRVLEIKDIYISSPDESLVLCEVEIYGDSVCKRGFFGRDCEHKCNCPESETCYVSTGECHPPCADGFEGETCLPCRSELYGPNCQLNCSHFCVKDDTGKNLCHNLNGSCTLGCVAGYQAPFCRLPCSDGKYGPHCSLTCSRNCARPSGSQGIYCDSANGSCIYGCTGGYKGENCSISVCPQGKYGPDCSLECSKTCYIPSGDLGKSTYCDPEDGYCVFGCVDGFSGANCDTMCNYGTFGRDCKSQCSHGCIIVRDDPNSFCNYTNGDCLHGCKVGFTGTDCMDKCHNGTYGPGCKYNCSQSCAMPSNVSDSFCNNADGDCLHGCKAGFTGTDCAHMCKRGTFGNNCSGVCTTRCAASKNPLLSPCNFTDGACLYGCVSNYNGTHCDKAFSLATTGDDTGWQIHVVLGLCTVCLLLPLILCLRTQRRETVPIEETIHHPFHYR